MDAPEVIHGGMGVDIRPFVLVNVPHLGRLQLTAESGETLKIGTVRPSQNPLFAGCDDRVTINNVAYHFSLRAYSGERLAKRRDERTDIVLTTDETWGATPYDIQASRVDAAYTKNVSTSAASKTCKRVVLFLDGYLSTPVAQRLVHEGDRFDRQKRALKAREEIERLRGLLTQQERVLAEALRLDVGDLLDLRQAFENDDDIFDAIHQIKRD